jgi:hypothetical protein
MVKSSLPVDSQSEDSLAVNHLTPAPVSTAHESTALVNTANPHLPSRLRKDHEANLSLVSKAFFDLLKTNGRVPTQEEIAEETGLSRATVQRHIQSVSFGELSQPARLAAPRVLATVVSRALAGHDSALKLFYKILKDGETLQDRDDTQDTRRFRDTRRTGGMSDRNGSHERSLSEMSDEELHEMAVPFITEYLDTYPDFLKSYLESRTAPRDRSDPDHRCDPQNRDGQAQSAVRVTVHTNTPNLPLNT